MTTCKTLHRREGRTVAAKPTRHRRQKRSGGAGQGRVGQGQGRRLDKGWIGNVAAAGGIAKACAHDKQIFILRKTLVLGKARFAAR